MDESNEILSILSIGPEEKQKITKIQKNSGTSLLNDFLCFADTIHYSDKVLVISQELT